MTSKLKLQLSNHDEIYYLKLEIVEKITTANLYWCQFVLLLLYNKNSFLYVRKRVSTLEQNKRKYTDIAFEQLKDGHKKNSNQLTRQNCFPLALLC